MLQQALIPGGANGSARHDGLGLVKVAILCLFLAAALNRAVHKDFSTGFDEVAHVSYVAHLQKSGEAWPDYASMRLLEPRKFRFGELPNYLNHPSPYYWLLARLGPSVEGRPESLLTLRLANVACVAIGLLALLMMRKEEGRSKIEEYAWYMPLFAIPVLPHLAGSVNNDNLAFLGGALALVAARRLLATRNGAWLVAALGATIVAGLAKLTGLLLVGGMVGGVLLIMMWRGEHRRWWFAAAVVAALVASLPYFALWAQYGGPAPDTPGQIELLKSTAPPEFGWKDAPRLSFAGYAGEFIKTFVSQWVPTPAERNTAQYAVLSASVFAIFCAFAGAWFSARELQRGKLNPDDVLVLAGSVSIAFTLACHLAFSYRHHLAYAYVADAYPRYYLPLAAIVPLAGLSLLSRMRDARAKTPLAGALIIGPIAVALFGAPLGQ
jgi:hypothetical protein